jgi:beta-glucanase (GH16 family)
MKTRPSLVPLLFCITCFASNLLAQAPNWQLVWSDEFSGSAIDSANWTYDTGGGGWGNNELEYYTASSNNSYISHDGSGNGLLVIEARKEQYKNRSYTSARLKTQGLQNFTYGRIEASIKVPNGVGVWPAFWMLGSNFPTVGWPACGELDIMEHVLPIGANTIRGSAHAPNYSGADSVHCDATPADLSGQFHLFAIEWSPTEIRYYLDSTLYFSATPNNVTCAGTLSSLPGAWIFDHPFFIILNLAIGGGWPGAPDSTTLFPVRMLVDYVRVYRDTNLSPPGNPLQVQNIAMSILANGKRNWKTVAAVKIVDGAGAPVSGATVQGVWNGLIQVGVNQGTTDATGIATLSSGQVGTSGTIQFCVSDVAKPGYTYTPAPGGACNSISR